MVTINGQKMGKSLGNFITLDQLFSGENKVLEQAYSPMTIRFFILQAHYRSPLDFSNEALKAAQKGYERLMAAVSALAKVKSTKENTVNIDELVEKCENAINDDLNTPLLISFLFDGVRTINSLIAGNEKINAENLEKLKKLYHDFVFDILGLKSEGESSDKNQEVLGKVLDMVMSIRTEAKQKKDWATSDKIRDELKKAGVLIKDTKEGYEWSLDD
jgi:cysteinyl-tRNA synthetase